MTDSNAFSAHQNTDDIEAVAVLGPTMSIDPYLGGLGQLFLFPPVNRFDGLPEPVPAARLHLDERHGPLPLDYQIDVATTGAKTALNNAPAGPLEPSLRDPLPELPERLPGR